MSESSRPRETRQRQAIRQAMAAVGRPLTPKEILAEASLAIEQLGIATVYRNLKTLQSCGEVEAIDIPGQPTRYHLGKNRRPHLMVCERTGQVYTLELKNQPEVGHTPVPFQLKETQVIYYGEITSPVTESLPASAAK